MTDIFAEMERDSGRFDRAPTDADSSRLTKLGRELVEIEDRLTRYAEVARELEERKRTLQFVELVSAMLDIGQDKLGLPDQNVDLVLDDYAKAGLPNPDTGKTPEEKARMAELREQGITWLTEDSPDLLTTTVTVTLPKGSLELASQIRTMLLADPKGISILLPASRMDLAHELLGQLTSEQGYGLDPDQVSIVGATGYGIDPARVKLDEGVHWATLTSFVKEQVREKKRTDLPLEALGATVGKIVKIVKRKSK